MALRSPLTLQPYDYIGDSTGRPLDKGQIYIGVAGQDPEFYQIPVFLDAEMTKPIDQPIRTNDGFVDFAGDLKEIYASDEIYSLKVLDKQGRKVIYKAQMMRDNLTDDALQSLNTAIGESQQAAENTLNATVDSITNDAINTVNDAINNTAVEGGVLADTFVTVTANGTGTIARTQRDKNADIISIKDFASLEEAQNYAIDNEIKIFIPSGEYEYNLADVDMSLFWGYGQLKDSVTGAIYKPKNGDFVTPEMFGIKEKIDETAKLSAMFNYAATNKLPVIFSKSAEYHFDEILIQGEDISVNWRTDNNVKVVLKCIGGKITGGSVDMFAIKIAGTTSETYPINQRILKGGDVVSFNPISTIKAGDLLMVTSSKLTPAESRGYSVLGMVNQVRKVINPSSFAMSEIFYEDFLKDLIWNTSVTEVISSRSVKFGSLNASPNEVESLLVFNTGVLQGAERGLVEWDNTTKIATFHGTQEDISGVVVGDTVTIRNTTVVSHIKPVDVSIVGNFHLVKDEELDYELGIRGQRGLYVAYARDAILSGLTIKNFPFTNALLEFSYNSLIEGMVNEGANNSYNGYDGLGYGISCSGSTHTTIQGSSFARCRRGVDVIGHSQAASWFTLVKDCHYTGGGLSYTGVPFFPSTVEGASSNSGFGNHGGAYYTTFDSCTVSYAFSGFVVRGIDTRITNCTQYGTTEQCVSFSQQRGCVIDNYTYQDKTSNLSALSPSGGATYFASLYATNQGADSAITIKNCTITSLSNAFIKVERNGTLPAFVVKDNDVRIAPPTTISNFYKLSINASSDGILFKIANSLFKNNRFIDTKSYIQRLVDYPGTVAVLQKSSYLENSTYKERILLPALETTKVLLRESSDGIKLSILPTARGRSFFLQDSILYYERSDTDVSPNALNNKTDIVLSSTIPSGTLASNKLTIAYSPTDATSTDRLRALYIYNGFNRDETVMLDVVLM